MIILFIVVSVILLVVAVKWMDGIDKMQEKHPDYKGEDFLDWDDNKQHTENV